MEGWKDGRMGDELPDRSGQVLPAGGREKNPAVPRCPLTPALSHGGERESGKTVCDAPDRIGTGLRRLT